jgi:hypothetical protein
MRTRLFAILWGAVAIGCSPQKGRASSPDPVPRTSVNRAIAEKPPNPGPSPRSRGEGSTAFSTGSAPPSPEIGGKGPGDRGQSSRLTLMECSGDSECGYDAARDACGAEPRFNRQPALVDQGIVCYCEAQRCALMRVAPVPCESDAGCAVNPRPRPHPVAASAEFGHERGKVCREYSISTTCERTNICTMHRHQCPLR